MCIRWTVQVSIPGAQHRGEDDCHFMKKCLTGSCPSGISPLYFLFSSLNNIYRQRAILA